MLEALPLPPDATGALSPTLSASALPPRKIEHAPIMRHSSGSERGGWPLFCRLLLWATRNARNDAGGQGASDRP